MAEQSIPNKFNGLKNPQVQSFLGASQYLGKRGIFYNEYDEPTYLGFYVEFDFNIGNILEENQNELPSGLLASPEKNYSAEKYLANIGYPDRAMNIQAFRLMLESLSKQTPWYITSIEGLDEVFKINPGENFRSKDKKIVLNFLEGIDMRVTSMFDLYRKSVYDTVYMRYLLPDIMRSFTMNIYVTEFRSFHGPENNSSHEEPTYTKTGGNVFGINTSKGPISQLASDTTDFFNGGASKKGAEIKKQFNDWVRGTGGSGTGPNNFYLQYIDNHISVIKFSLIDCEFILETLEPSWGADLNTSTSTPATYKAEIKIGKIREVADYPIMLEVLKELKLSDRPNTNKFSNSNFSDEYLSEPTYDGIKAKGKTFDGKTEARKIKGESDNPNDVYSSGPYREGHLRPVSDTNKKSLGERLLNNLEEIAYSRAKDFLEENVGGYVLGNVYGLSPSTMIRQLSENPLSIEQALKDVISKTTNAETAEKILENIYQNLPEPGAELGNTPSNVGLTGPRTLVTNLGNTGLTGSNSNMNGNVGNIGLVAPSSSQANPSNVGLKGANSDINGNVGNVGLNGSPSPINNPGNVGLVEPSSPQTNPGNVDLQSNNSTIQGNPSRLILDTNPSSMDNNPGNVGIDTNNSNINDNAGNVGLSENNSSMEGSIQNVELKENSIRPSELGNVELRGNNSVIDGSIKNVDLIGNSKDINGDPGSVDLSSNGATISGNPGNIKLSGKEGKLENPGNVELSAPVQKTVDVGNIGLTGENKLMPDPGNIGLNVPTTEKENPGNVGLTGPTNKTEIISKVELTGAESKVSELGKIGLVEEDVKITNPGNIGLVAQITPTDDKLENIGFESNENKNVDLKNISFDDDNATMDGSPGNINLVENKKAEEILGNINLTGAKPIDTDPGNIGLTEVENKIDTERNIGLEGNESTTFPEPGTAIQNSSSDLYKRRNEHLNKERNNE